MITPETSLLTGPKVLVVDDDDLHRSACVRVLQSAGYRVLVAVDGVEALESLDRDNPDFVLLDVAMPRKDGWQALAEIRERGSRVPVLMLTGLADVMSRVRGLTSGADDFVAKPCDHRELLARVHALLRRTQPERRVSLLQFGPVRVDLDRRAVTTSAGEAPSLTRTEFALLELLVKHVGRTVSRETILDAIWGYGPDTVTRTVETHVWRLRRKLGDDAAQPRWIRTVQGSGYRLEADAVVVSAEADAAVSA